MHHNWIHRLSALESNWKRCSILIFSESSVCLIYPLPRAGWKMFELVVLGLDSALCHLGVNLGRKLWRPWKFLWCKEEQKPTPSTEEVYWCVSVAGLGLRKTIFVTAGFQWFDGVDIVHPYCDANAGDLLHKIWRGKMILWLRNQSGTCIICV